MYLGTLREVVTSERADRGVSLGESHARMVLLSGFGVALGLVGGGAAFAVVRLVALISDAALLHRLAFTLPDLSRYHPGPLLVPVAVGGGLVVALLARWSPVIQGHGIPESLEAVITRESRIRPRVLLAKPLSAAIAMGTGGPFGAEGPIIVTGSCIGSLLGQLVRVSPAERRILLATGAAAGMAGVFSTPIAAVVLAFELLLFERSLRALLPLVLATGIAAELHTILLGSGPLFAISGSLDVTAVQLPLFLVLGVAVGLLAIALNRGLFAWEGAFRRLPVPRFLHPLIGAVAFASIGFVVPGSLSVGYWAISDAVNGRFLLGAAAALFVAKLFSWWISLASNTSGGTLAPIFLIGATMGDVLGAGLARLFPSAHLDPATFAVVAMGATFGVAARALLTGGIFALEVTGAYHLVVPMLLTLGVAEVVAELGLTERLMTEKLARRGLRVELDTEVDRFRAARADQAMDPLPGGVGTGSGVGTAGGVGRAGGVGTGGAPCVDRSSSLLSALPLFLVEGADQVVVTDGGTAIGVIRREVISEVVIRHLAESEPQAPRLGRRTGHRRAHSPPGRRSARWLPVRLRSPLPVDPPGVDSSGDEPSGDEPPARGTLPTAGELPTAVDRPEIQASTYPDDI